MDAFVAMRKYISNNLIEQKYINNIVIKHEEDIILLKNLFDKLEANKKNNHIFFEGQIYDAYSLMMRILDKAKNEIKIIDNYVGRELFDMIKDMQIKIKIYSKNIDNESLQKYKLQYDNIEIINSDKFHDRFIIIDNNILYHCGSSFKDLGKKCFAITLIEDKNILLNIMNVLDNKM